MYKNILRQIVNAIFINVQYVEQPGLFNGKLGIALFFYEYSRYTDNSIYSDFSDDYTEDVYNNLEKNPIEYFSNGLIGTGWFIDYIIKKHFVEVDEDENILEEIDEIAFAMSYADFILEMQGDIPLFSKGLYAIQRGKESLISKTLLSCKELLENKDTVEMPFSYCNSIFYFINKALGMSANKELGRILIERLHTLFSSHISHNKFNHTDLFILKRNIDNMCLLDQKELWLDLVKADQTHSVEDISLFERGWVNLIYTYDMQQDVVIDLSDLQKQLKHTIDNLEANDLLLHNGLAGLGLELINSSK